MPAGTAWRRSWGDGVYAGEVYRQYRRQIYGFAWLRLGNQQAAEDVTATVFARLVERERSGQPEPERVDSWLYTVAQNLVTDQFRGREWQVEGLDEWLSDRTEDRQSAEYIERREWLYKALGTLAADQLAALELRYWHGMSTAEMAAALWRSVGAVKILQHRAMEKLRTRAAWLML